MLMVAIKFSFSHPEEGASEGYLQALRMAQHRTYPRTTNGVTWSVVSNKSTYSFDIKCFRWSYNNIVTDN
jgi:hypothetical protein